jgi:hypothetical protein
MERIPDEELIGLKSGRLTIQKIVGVSASRKRLVQCRCECGNTKTINISQFRSGVIRSCGCLLQETARKNMKRVRHLGEGNRLRHGQTDTPEYYIWRTMKGRCLNPNNSHFRRYGGRGITIADRWRLFDHFFADMGKRPSPRHQLDRIDNDGPYAPENCRWATPKQQGNNRSTNVKITHDGETLTMAEWARRKGMNRMLLFQRLKKGWTVEKALNTPPISRSLRTKHVINS